MQTLSTDELGIKLQKSSPYELIINTFLLQIVNRSDHPDLS